MVCQHRPSLRPSFNFEFSGSIPKPEFLFKPDSPYGYYMHAVWKITVLCHHAVLCHWLKASLFFYFAVSWKDVLFNPETHPNISLFSAPTAWTHPGQAPASGPQAFQPYILTSHSIVFYWLLSTDNSWLFCYQNRDFAKTVMLLNCHQSKRVFKHEQFLQSRMILWRYS